MVSTDVLGSWVEQTACTVVYQFCYRNRKGEIIMYSKSQVVSWNMLCYVFFVLKYLLSSLGLMRERERENNFMKMPAETMRLPPRREDELSLWRGHYVSLVRCAPRGLAPSLLSMLVAPTKLYLLWHPQTYLFCLLACINISPPQGSKCTVADVLVWQHPPQISWSVEE